MKRSGKLIWGKKFTKSNILTINKEAKKWSGIENMSLVWMGGQRKR